MMGYGEHAQVVSQHPIELVDTHIATKASDVSYTQLVQQINIDAYFSAYIGFSFDRFLQSQHNTIQRVLNAQETHTYALQQTVVIASLQQHTSLSDDTDSVRFLVFLT